MFKYDHDSGRIYDPTDDETIGYLDAQPKSRGLRMAVADDLFHALSDLVDDIKKGRTEWEANGNLFYAIAALSEARGES